MQIDTDKLLTITNFAKQKGLTRQHIYRLIDSNSLNAVDIDGIAFVIIDDKAEQFQRARREKKKIESE